MATSKINTQGWKYLGSSAGSTDLSIQGIDFSELLLIVKGSNNVTSSTVVLKAELPSSGNLIRGGVVSTSSANVRYTLYVSTTRVRLEWVEGMTAASNVTVYYK